LHDTPQPSHHEGQEGSHEVEPTVSDEVNHAQQQHAIHSFLDDEKEILVHHWHPDEVNAAHLHGSAQVSQRQQQRHTEEEDAEGGGEADSVGEEAREDEGGAQLHG
jgi:hypothetical protein